MSVKRAFSESLQLSFSLFLIEEEAKKKKLVKQTAAHTHLCRKQVKLSFLFRIAPYKICILHCRSKSSVRHLFERDCWANLIWTTNNELVFTMLFFFISFFFLRSFGNRNIKLRWIPASTIVCESPQQLSCLKGINELIWFEPTTSLFSWWFFDLIFFCWSFGTQKIHSAQLTAFLVVCQSPEKSCCLKVFVERTWFDPQQICFPSNLLRKLLSDVGLSVSNTNEGEKNGHIFSKLLLWDFFCIIFADTYFQKNIPRNTDSSTKNFSAPASQ